ncbi:hypothetical protein AXA44_02695 [Rhodococcus sp. SC4]|nr:hypothetical protein AXA44_02695 [Rhodococcus sp. SC4]
MIINKASTGLYRPLWRIHTEKVSKHSGFWSYGMPVMLTPRPVIVCGDDRTIAEARREIAKLKGGLAR